MLIWISVTDNCYLDESTLAAQAGDISLWLRFKVCSHRSKHCYYYYYYY